LSVAVLACYIVKMIDPVRIEAVHIEESWHQRLAGQFAQPYFPKLLEFVRDEYQSHTVYPPVSQMFRAFDLCAFDATKVVILGQDPYHGPGQANGLCFAVNAATPPPPSLKNVFKELDRDLGRPVSPDPTLLRWAAQGVLLLNATLTVRAGAAGSHQNKGWETFTDAAIAAVAKEKKGIVFLLWGNTARRKGASINRDDHLVLESAHPSPLSAHNGFFGSAPFSKVNDYLVARGAAPIEW
jgi:uracil-DNA glycosylase